MNFVKFKLNTILLPNLMSIFIFMKDFLPRHACNVQSLRTFCLAFLLVLLVLLVPFVQVLHLRQVLPFCLGVLVFLVSLVFLGDLVFRVYLGVLANHQVLGVLAFLVCLVVLVGLVSLFDLRMEILVLGDLSGAVHGPLARNFMFKTRL